jgi:hypothetical protein
MDSVNRQILLRQRRFKEFSPYPAANRIGGENMSEVLEAITDMIQVIADNPASILIVLGFISTVSGVIIPLEIGQQTILVGLGLLMLIAGIILHIIWLRRR